MYNKSTAIDLLYMSKDADTNEVNLNYDYNTLDQIIEFISGCYSSYSYYNKFIAVDLLLKIFNIDMSSVSLSFVLAINFSQ
jgi:hypothetical protein